MADSPTSVELQSRINATRREYEDLEDGDCPEVATAYGADVERLVDLHEQLDELTRERQQAEGREPAKSARIVNIQGRE